MTFLFKKIDEFFASRSGRFWFWLGTLISIFFFGLMYQNYIAGWPGPATNIGVIDPDVWIRMTKVRELIQDGNLHNHLVTATNAPFGGIETPWTRVVDFILVFLYQFTPSDLSIEKRLLYVANWYPLLIETAILFFIIKGAETGFKSFQKIAVVAVYVIGSLINSRTHSYFMVGNTDHHSLMSLLWVITIWLMLAKPTRYKSVALGAAMGTWFWVSPEALPFIFTVFVILGAKTILNPALSINAILTSITVVFISVLALFIEYPTDRILSNLYYDSVSIIYTVFFSFCAAGFMVLNVIVSRQTDIKKRFATAGASAVVLAGIFLAIFPKFIKGPMANAEPYILTNFLPHVWEATPILKAGIQISLTTLYMPAIAFLLALRFWKKQPVLLCLLLVPFIMVFFQLKWSFYLEAVSIVVIAKLLPTYIVTLRQRYNIKPLFLQAIYPIIIIHIVVFYTLNLLPASRLMMSSDVSDCNAFAFQSVQSGELVRVLGSSPITIETNILGNSGMTFFTPYHYVASYYHREGVGLKTKDTIFNAKDLNEIRPLLKAHNVTALYICPFSGQVWTNAYFYDKQKPEYNWVTMNNDLNILNKGSGTIKPILLNIKP